MTRRIDLTYKAGDTRGIVVTITDSSGAVNLTAINNGTGDIEFGLYDDRKGITERIKKTFSGGGISITDVTNGITKVNLLRSDTAEFDRGFYPYEVSLITDADNEVAVLEGVIQIERSRLR